MSLELNAKETALVLIDLQNGIVGRQLAPYSGTDVVAAGAKLANAVRSAGGAVVYVHVLVNEVLPLNADKSMPRPKEPFPPEASDLVESAGYQNEKDVLITKRQWDAFYATNLDQVLRRRGVKTVILAGIATNFGVESTARSAQARGYDLVFAEDAMTTMAAEMHTFAVETLFPIIGRVRKTDEIVQALGGGKKSAASETAPPVVDGEQGAYN
jgi:nicotinamidase-related amidase